MLLVLAAAGVLAILLVLSAAIRDGRDIIALHARAKQILDQQRKLMIARGLIADPDEEPIDVDPVDEDATGDAAATADESAGAIPEAGEDVRRRAA